MSKNSLPMRDLRVEATEGLDMECVSMLFVSLGAGLIERTALAFVQDDLVRDGTRGGDSGEKREGRWWSGDGMIIERCSLNRERYS